MLGVLRAEWPSRPGRHAHLESGSRCFSASPRLRAPPLSLYSSLPRPLMALCATSGKGQQLPTGCDPGAGSSPSSRARCPPGRRVSVEDAKPSPAAPVRPVRSDPPTPCSSCSALGLRFARLPAAARRPALKPPGRPGREDSRTRWPASRSAQAAVPLQGLGTQFHRGADREPGLPNSAPARACGGFGAGGLPGETVTQTWRNLRVGTCRPGGRGRRRLRYAPPLGSPRPGRPRAARPAPARAASLPARKEPTESPRQLTQAVSEADPLPRAPGARTTLWFRCPS